MHVNWSYRTPVMNFISCFCQHVNVLEFLGTSLNVLILNIVVLGGYYGCLNMLILERKFAHKLKVI
jgi:hypothetical protein